jgi:hypothetical protein
MLYPIILSAKLRMQATFLSMAMSNNACFFIKAAYFKPLKWSYFSSQNFLLNILIA